MSERARSQVQSFVGAAQINLQYHKHAASVVESSRDCHFCCGIIKVEATQLINVTEQILTAGEKPIQFGSSISIEPRSAHSKNELCPRCAKLNLYARAYMPTNRAKVTVRMIPGPLLPSVFENHITLVTKLRRCTSASSFSPYRSRKYS
jgi:hypothetical protein